MLRKVIDSLTLGILLATHLSTALADELVFAEVYAIARSAAPELAMAKYRVDGAEAEKDIATRRLFPQLRLFGQYSENSVKYDDNLFYGDQSYPGKRYGLQVSQPLLNVPDGIEARRMGLIYDQSVEELAVAEGQLLSQLLEAYLQVLLADTELEQFQTELKALESQLSEAEALYQRNLIPVTQVLETKSRTEALRADVIRAQGDAAIAREMLIQLTGQRGIEPLPVRDSFNFISRYASAEAAGEAALDNDPAIAAAETALTAAKSAIDRERGSWIPEIDITYSYQHSDVGFDNLSSPPRDTSTLAIGFNYPLFEGGAKSARIRAAWAEYYSAKTVLEAQQRESEARARAAWLNLEAISRRLVAARQSTQTTEVSVDASRKAVKAGTARVTDVLIALAQNTSAQRDLSSAKFQFAMGWVELELATGGIPQSIVPAVSAALHGR